MAQLELRFSDNSPGLFYVDSNCIACDTCVGIAPRHFRLTSDYDHAIVVQQPQTEKEVSACNEALSCCPVSAIGANGDTL
jgi:ferredoxin